MEQDKIVCHLCGREIEWSVTEHGMYRTLTVDGQEVHICIEARIKTTKKTGPDPIAPPHDKTISLAYGDLCPECTLKVATEGSEPEMAVRFRGGPNDIWSILSYSEKHRTRRMNEARSAYCPDHTHEEVEEEDARP